MIIIYLIYETLNFLTKKTIISKILCLITKFKINETS